MYMLSVGWDIWLAYGAGAGPRLQAWDGEYRVSRIPQKVTLKR